MKHSYPLLLQLSLYTLFSFSTLTKSTPVLDADGHQLQAGAQYYIVPFQSGNGGGLALSAKDIPCPLYVMQENLETSNGLPLRLLPADTKQQPMITLSTDLNIVFNAATICVQSTAWKVGGVEGNTGQRYVMSHGVIGNPGAATVSSWFKIERAGNVYGYKIVYCPSVCGSCKVVCGNLGVFSENGKRWLGLSDNPLVILFKKSLIT